MFGNKSNKEKRFKVISEESVNMNVYRIFQDTLTGVQYLSTQNMNGLGGVTPLLDKEGKVVVTDLDNKD